jgi:hypothetical protein
LALASGLRPKSSAFRINFSLIFFVSMSFRICCNYFRLAV